MHSPTPKAPAAKSGTTGTAQTGQVTLHVQQFNVHPGTSLHMQLEFVSNFFLNQIITKNQTFQLNGKYFQFTWKNSPS